MGAKRHPVQLPSLFTDKRPVSFLLDNARHLMEVAQSKDPGESVWTFMVGPEGGIEMVLGADEPLDILLRTRGARAGSQLRREKGMVRVEGRMGKEKCLIEQPLNTAGKMGGVLSLSRMYELRDEGE